MDDLTVFLTTTDKSLVDKALEKAKVKLGKLNSCRKPRKGKNLSVVRFFY